MKYTKALNLWSVDVAADIRAGRLLLQRGQWLRCGSGKPCRYIGTNGRTIDVVHWQGNATATDALFRLRIEMTRKGVK